jgi:hypothetical protein
VEEARARAYRVLLAQGLLHLKWDLAGLLGGLSWFRPRLALAQARAARRAALRAYAFHNLAIHSTFDFAGFSEEAFWSDIDRFRRGCPDALCPYREVFERCLRGEPVHIVAPSGVGQDVRPGTVADRDPTR